jgi:hypothetical protein
MGIFASALTWMANSWLGGGIRLRVDGLEQAKADLAVAGAASRISIVWRVALKDERCGNERWTGEGGFAKYRRSADSGGIRVQVDAADSTVSLAAPLRACGDGGVDQAREPDTYRVVQIADGDSVCGRVVEERA